MRSPHNMVQWNIFAAVVALAAVPFMLSPSATWLLSTVLEPIFYALLTWCWPASRRCERLHWEDIPDGSLCGHTSATGWDHLCFIEHKSTDCLQSTIGTIFFRAWVSAQRREKSVKKPKALDLRRSYVCVDIQTLRSYLMLAEEEPKFFDHDQPLIKFQYVQDVLTAHLTTKAILGGPASCSMTKDDLNCLLHGYPPFYRKTFRMTNGTLLTSPTTDPGTTLTSPIKDSSDIPRAGWIVACGLSNIVSVGRHTMMPSNMPTENCFWKDTVVRSSFRRFQRALENLVSAFPDDEFAAKGLEIYRMIVIEGKDMGTNDKQLWHMLGCVRGITNIKHETKLTAEEWTVAMNCFNHWDQLTIDEIKTLQQGRVQYVLIAAFRGLMKVIRYGNGRRSTFIPCYPELSGHKYVYLSACMDENDK